MEPGANAKFVHRLYELAKDLSYTNSIEPTPARVDATALVLRAKEILDTASKE